MSCRGVFAAAAEQDLLDIDDHLVLHAGIAVADATIEALARRCSDLATFPERGNIPVELEAVGVLGYREIHERPFRIVYRVLEGDVVIYLVADARRDVRTMLERRLLR